MISSRAQASLAAHNESFSTLLSMIPAKHYLAREDMLYGGQRPLEIDEVSLKRPSSDRSGVTEQAFAIQSNQPGKLSKKQKKALKAQNDEAAKELALAKRQAKKAKVRVCAPSRWLTG